MTPRNTTPLPGYPYTEKFVPGKLYRLVCDPAFSGHIKTWNFTKVRPKKELDGTVSYAPAAADDRYGSSTASIAAGAVVLAVGSYMPSPDVCFLVFLIEENLVYCGNSFFEHHFLPINPDNADVDGVL